MRIHEAWLKGTMRPLRTPRDAYQMDLRSDGYLLVRRPNGTRYVLSPSQIVRLEISERQE